MRAVHHGPITGLVARPADAVTLIRTILVCGVAALVATSFVTSVSVPALVSLASAALVLDAVDGWIARRTGTTTPFGARFDMEVDAFLILALSVYVAASLGWWVALIGLARYAFGAAGWLLPWLRAPVPPRYWSKVVAAVQGVALTVAAAALLPNAVIEVAVAVALVVLIESFGHQVWWLWQHRTSTKGTRVRTFAAWTLTICAGLLVWFALLAPDRLSALSPLAFVRIPLEALVLVVLVLVLPRRAGRIVAMLVGVLLGVLTIVKILDMGFFAALSRPFDPLSDWSYLGSAEGLLGDSIGRGAAILTVAGAIALGLALLVFLPLAVLRVTRLVARHRVSSIRVVSLLGAAWILCAAIGVQFVQGAPLASSSAANTVYDEVQQVRTDLRDRQAFAKQLAAPDPLRSTPTRDLLTGLRGKDVIVAFVESYGRVAVQDSSFSPPVDGVLKAGTAQLHAAGFDSRSAFLTSPTFGGISWLAHSTLQSGLWISSQPRYDDLVASNRFTLSDAFKRAGWRTVVDVPSNSTSWSEAASFYHYDKSYDLRNVGYAGPSFSYASMPDEYTFAAFQRLELAKRDRRPVMAEIDLVSSHTPWTPLPHMVPWSRVGDGSVYDGMPAQGPSPNDLWSSGSRVQRMYGESVQYSLRSLIAFVQHAHDNNLVLVVLGDHQPATVVSGEHSGHDVPISIIAHDPSVLNRISDWGWQAGLLPGPDAPVWPMDAFRDKFLTAYGTQRH